MKDELVGPAASLAAAILGQKTHVEMTNDLIAATFRQAYAALEQGIQELKDEEERLGKVPVAGIY